MLRLLIPGHHRQRRQVEYWTG